MPRKPAIRKGVASHYAASNEAIYDLTSPSTATGGLISVVQRDDGTLVVDLYRLDPNVLVRVPFANLDADHANVQATVR